MRLPLGILSGMGFIGAGATLRKGDAVRGVTTAATLWIVTMLGLCFGGGQMALGYSGLAVSLGVVRGLRFVEAGIKQEHHARFTMVAAADGPTEESVRARLEREGYAIASCRIVRARDGWRVSWQVSWNGKHGDTHVLRGFRLRRWRSLRRAPTAVRAMTGTPAEHALQSTSQ
jgi:putative Mg2+ transporter-C (MgtC) family protein